MSVLQRKKKEEVKYRGLELHERETMTMFILDLKLFNHNSAIFMGG